jgi:hypothetical protein
MTSQAISVRQAKNQAKPDSYVPSSVQQQGAAFQYIGKTAMTAAGPISGRQYRFDYPGAIVVADSRDRVALATVPNLRQI